jgi:hypothetical protein
VVAAAVVLHLDNRARERGFDEGTDLVQVGHAVRIAGAR